MTEQEAIAIIKKNYPKCCKMVNGRYEGGFDDTDCEKRLTDMFGGELSLEGVTDELERYLKEPDNTHPINAKILTYEDAAAWDAYRAIGTPEECLRNKDFLRFLANSMNQKKYETYLGIYNAVEKDGHDEE